MQAHTLLPLLWSEHGQILRTILKLSLYQLWLAPSPIKAPGTFGDFALTVPHP